MGKVIGFWYFHEKKVAAPLLADWNRNRNTSLYDAYANPSYAKEQAWHRCQEICYVLGGQGLCVTSHNRFMFTASFVITDSETGEITDVVKITPDYNYIAHIKN